MAMCAPNPDACGGTGKCEGSTAELAFEYLTGSTGMYQEYQYSYTSYYGELVPFPVFAAIAGSYVACCHSLCQSVCLVIFAVVERGGWSVIFLFSAARFCPVG